MPQTHHLTPTRESLHGQYSPDLPPALRISSGDAVVYKTLDVSWGMGQHPLEGDTRPKFGPRASPRDDGPAMCGPVYVEGAAPGMTLEVQIEELVPADWGWTWVGGAMGDAGYRARLGLSGAPLLLRWSLDVEAMIATSERGHRVRLAPFLGVIGLAPGAPGWSAGWWPGRTGGNLDCRELVVGARLFLPIEVEGALVSVGDAHAAQGDGEVAGSAIECVMERARLRFVLHEAPGLDGPFAETPAGLLTLGLGATLDEAAERATAAMIRLLAQRLGVEPQEAAALASVAVHLRVTQMVNGVRGVHALLPHGALL
jgi:acetamidase/formamidase